MLDNINKALRKFETSKYNKVAEKVLKEVKADKEGKDFHIEALKEIRKSDSLDIGKALFHISRLSEEFFGLSPYKSQIKAALVLNSGQIAELATGEGKTLSVVIAALLNFLKSGRTHIITANEYLVERDFEFSRELFEALGVSTVLLGTEKKIEEKAFVYQSDVVYATSKGLVFDYLNNNRIRLKEQSFEEDYDMVIIDEIDFVLIDEARTPIVTSGAVETDVEKYKLFAEIQDSFKGYKKKPDDIDPPSGYDFVQSVNGQIIELTDQGYDKLETELRGRGVMTENENIFDGEGFSYISYMEKALRAKHTLRENIDYIMLPEHGIVPINPQTGRPQPGRRFSNGVHQALEAMLGLNIEQDSKSLGQTTLQNFLKKYKVLSGTTGTASTEEAEFKEFYSLKVLPVDPNVPSKRDDKNDILFLGNKQRLDAIVEKIKENKEIGRPTLIGTQTLEDSESIAKFLDKESIQYNLLNAKEHEKEAYVVANAGTTGTVTIATNMAGRGTDIMLGGNKDYTIESLVESGSTKEAALAKWEEQNKAVVAAGGLSIIGLSRGFSRRLDNQLIGRSGRQGDAGETQFYLSLDDELFSAMPIAHLKSNWEKNDDSEGLSFNFLTKIVREAQKNIESGSFNQRKNLFKFDNVNSEQREIFYSWRKSIVAKENLTSIVENYYKLAIKNIVIANLEAEEFFANNFNQMEADFAKKLGQTIDIREISKANNLEDADDVIEFISGTLLSIYNEKMSVLEDQIKFNIEKDFLIRVMDEAYAENISNLETMRSSTSLRSYAQKNPLDEYQQEALEMFSNLVKDVKSDFIVELMRFSPENYFAYQRKMQELRKSLEEGEASGVAEGQTVTLLADNSSSKRNVDKLFQFIGSIGI